MTAVRVIQPSEASEDRHKAALARECPTCLEPAGSPCKGTSLGRRGYQAPLVGMHETRVPRPDQARKSRWDDPVDPEVERQWKERLASLRTVREHRRSRKDLAFVPFMGKDIDNVLDLVQQLMHSAATDNRLPACQHEQE